MARRRCAEAHKILVAKVSDRTQQIVPITQPCFMLGDNRGAVAVLPDLERVAPLAAPTDLDGERRAPACHRSMRPLKGAGRNGAVVDLRGDALRWDDVAQPSRSRVGNAACLGSGGTWAGTQSAAD